MVENQTEATRAEWFGNDQETIMLIREIFKKEEQA